MTFVYPQLDGVKINEDRTLPIALIQAIRKAYDYVTQVDGAIPALPVIIENTHANRSSYPPGTLPPGSLYIETDRNEALYVIQSVSSARQWVLIEGNVTGLLANRFTDLGLYDVGFLYYATDGLNYLWNGTSWTTLDYVRGGLTLTAVNTLPKITATGILGLSAVSDDGTNVILAARGLELDNAKGIAWKDTAGTYHVNATLSAINQLGLFNNPVVGGNAGHIQLIASDRTTIHLDLTDSGIALSQLTASLPLKLTAGKIITAAKIDLGSASDVTGTGLTSTFLPKWDGTKLVDAAPAVSTNTASTIVLRDSGGSFAARTGTFVTAACSTSVQCGLGTDGSVNLVQGNPTNTGYTEWRLASGTRLGRIGEDTTDLTVHLESGATFIVVGGGAFVASPANTTKAVVVVDTAQTLTSKDLTATSNTFALPVIQRNDSISLTGQTTTIAATPLHVGGVTAPAGIYRVSVYMYTTTVGGAGTATASVNWNDGAASHSFSSLIINLNTTGATGFTQGTVAVRADGANDITVSVTVAGAVGGPIYSIYATLERVL
jgi:hypothetical protein